MKTSSKSTSTSSATMNNKYLTLLTIFIVTIFFSISAQAIDANFSLHQGDESDTQGVSLMISDKFSKSGDLYWNLGYSYLDEVKVEWNNSDLFFKVDTVDAIISYRYKPKSYNQFFKLVTIETQIGATIALTENKFVWPELEQEKYFSESNDINLMLGVNVYYDTSKNTAINLGFKYQPSFSEFDDISTIYLGFTYKFGAQYGY